MYKVFIVDDEPFIIDGLYDIVDWAQIGLEIVGHAGDGQEALQILQSQPVPVDLLITDISMPRMNGLELITAMRKSHPQMKVIILSGYDEFDYLKQGMALGIENYLLKPINLEEFKSTLVTIVEKLDSSQAEYKLNEFSLAILRDNVMNRWLRGGIAQPEFEERINILGITMDKPLILVALLRPQHSRAEMFQAVQKQVEACKFVIPFQDIDGDIVLLYMLSEYQRGKEQVDEIHGSLRQLLTSYHPLRLSVGSVEETLEATQSYNHAKRVQEYFMLFPERECILFEEVQSHTELAAQALPISWEDDLKLVVARDKEGLLQRINQTFEQLRHLDGVTPELLQDIAMEWMIRLKMQLKEIRHVEEPILFQEAFGIIRSITSINELVAVIQEAAAITVDALTKDVKSPVVQQVLSYITEHYSSDLSLKTLGAKYKIHPVYLGQLFHKEVGESFTEYINRYRIERAKEELRTSSLKVYEIARNVGYWETGYFYKQFKKYVGVSPTDYKGLI